MNQSDEKLILTESAIVYLDETAKWAKFLAITGFVMSGLMVILGIFMGTFFNGLMQPTMAQSQQNVPMPNMRLVMCLMYIIVAIFYPIPCMYLYRFAIKIKLALDNTDSYMLSEALENQKSLFMFMGIATIVVLEMYAMDIVMIIIGGSIFALMK